jgi:hypothetical protein
MEPVVVEVDSTAVEAAPTDADAVVVEVDSTAVEAAPTDADVPTDAAGDIATTTTIGGEAVTTHTPFIWSPSDRVAGSDCEDCIWFKIATQINGDGCTLHDYATVDQQAAFKSGVAAALPAVPLTTTLFVVSDESIEEGQQQLTVSSIVEYRAAQDSDVYNAVMLKSFTDTLSSALMGSGALSSTAQLLDTLTIERTDKANMWPLEAVLDSPLSQKQLAEGTMKVEITVAGVKSSEIQNGAWRAAGETTGENHGVWVSLAGGLLGFAFAVAGLVVHRRGAHVRRTSESTPSTLLPVIQGVTLFPAAASDAL